VFENVNTSNDTKTLIHLAAWVADQSTSQCPCLIKCYSKLWLQWQKVLIVSWSCICFQVLLYGAVSFRICPGDQDVRQWKTGGIMFW